MSVLWALWVTWELIGFYLRIKDPDRITGLETNRIA